MSAEIRHLPTDGPAPLPVDIHNRINSKIAALAVESHILQHHWGDLPQESRRATLVEVKRLSHDLYQMTLAAIKGESR